jgi:ribose transport system ATP-binding protein
MPNSRDEERYPLSGVSRTNAERPLLEMTGIRKAFPGVKAISSGSFDLRAGEIHALVGENGAGKSTLIKVLTGVHRSDAGQITLNGTQVSFSSPLEARRTGIATIYQEFTLVPALTVRANLFLGQERTSRGLIDTEHERRQAAALFTKLKVHIDPEALVSELTVAQQQLVEIARALLSEARILVMDEPTAAITPREVETLFDILRDLTARGIGIIFISHRLDEIFANADRVTVMRDGSTIATSRTSEITRRALIEQMVGRPLEEEFPRIRVKPGEVRFEVRNLSGGPIKDVSFEVKRGEVLGMAGLMGAGRTETARLIFGADRKASGTVILDGRQIQIEAPRDAIRHGICLLTEDRKLQGLVLKATAKDNFALPNLGLWSRLGWIDHRKEKSRFYDRVDNLNIRVSGPDQRAEELSGGNQQKLLVARWLETNSQVIIFDEPTRGIDVGAKYEMYLLINELAAQGKAVIVISSELPEVLGISDRILVMKEGRISGEITDVTKAKQEDVMALAI